jgi:hypothetical protein
LQASKADEASLQIDARIGFLLDELENSSQSITSEETFALPVPLGYLR